MNFVVSKFQVPTTVDINPLFAKQVFVSCVAIHSHMTTKVGVAINVHEVLPSLKFERFICKYRGDRSLTIFIWATMP